MKSSDYKKQVEAVEQGVLDAFFAPENRPLLLENLTIEIQDLEERKGNLDKRDEDFGVRDESVTCGIENLGILSRQFSENEDEVPAGEVLQEYDRIFRIKGNIKKLLKSIAGVVLENKEDAQRSISSMTDNNALNTGKGIEFVEEYVVPAAIQKRWLEIQRMLTTSDFSAIWKAYSLLERDKGGYFSQIRENTDLDIFLDIFDKKIKEDKEFLLEDPGEDKAKISSRFLTLTPFYIGFYDSFSVEVDDFCQTTEMPLSDEQKRKIQEITESILSIKEDEEDNFFNLFSLVLSQLSTEVDTEIFSKEKTWEFLSDMLFSKEKTDEKQQQVQKEIQEAFSSWTLNVLDVFLRKKTQGVEDLHQAIIYPYRALEWYHRFFSAVGGGIVDGKSVEDHIRELINGNKEAAKEYSLHENRGEILSDENTLKIEERFEMITPEYIDEEISDLLRQCP